MSNFTVSPIGSMGNPTVISSAAPGQARQGRGGVAGAQAYPSPYQTDGYHGNVVKRGSSFAPAAPIQMLANDWRQPVNYIALRIARRLDSLGVDTTADLLKRAGSSFGRSMLATMVAAFDKQVTKAMATQWINYWLGTSDLMRTGMSIDTARLLQASGIHDVPSLARYWAPMDRLALYGALTTNAIRFGYRMPSWGEFTQSLDVARSLPMAIRW